MLVNEIVSSDRMPETDQITDIPLDENPAKVYDLCLQMERLCDASGGIGLSAVQVGVPWKLFIVKSDGNNPLIPEGYGYFVNCDYEKDTDTKQIVSVEGCLSIRSEEGRLRYFQVERYEYIRLYGYKVNKEKMLYEKIDCKLGFANQGIVFQHEIDHQLGILISKIGKEIYIW